MENTFMENLTNATNFMVTENGALAHKSTRSMVYDMFAFGGAYRKRTDEDCILLFKNAYEENPELALKCLFYLRDCRGGQGERRFFRVCFRWLCSYDPAAARRNLIHLSEYGRWDDLIYTTFGSELMWEAFKIIQHQLALDVECKTPSLLAKWMPSENASSWETKKMANELRKYLGMTHKQYRKTLSILRARINVLERLMSANRWEEIEFDKIPSKAGLIYKNAFARRDIIAKKYEAFAKSSETKVNAKTLYPYEVVEQALKAGWYPDNDTDRAMIEKYWNSFPDYFNGEPVSIMCVVDTSGSMHGMPINVAISLGIYCAERIGGPFAGHYISFASRPQLIKVEGVDFVDKVKRIYNTNLCDNTNLEATFDLVLEMAKKSNPEDVPKTLVVISDMQIDAMTGSYWGGPRAKRWTEENAATEMELIRQKWADAGIECPRLVYWNVDARDNTILDAGPNVSFVSGCSPVLYEQIVRGVTGYDLMLDKLMSERYALIA